MTDTTDPPSVKTIGIIGAGITGLSAAYRCLELARSHNQPIKLTLLEAAPQHGGMLATRKIDDYLVEFGGDMFITNKPGAVNLCKRLGLENSFLETDPTYRKSLVLSQGKPVEVPLGFNLMAPARMMPMLKTSILSPLAKLRMGWEYFVPRKKNFDEDESLASFVRRRLGTEALERLIQPLVGGIYTSDPEKLSLQATLPRFLEMEQKYGSLIKAMRAQARVSSGEQDASGARYGLFLGLKGGMQELLDTLQEKVSQEATINYQTTVRNIAKTANGYQLELDSTEEENQQQTLNVDALIATTPAYTTAKLLEEIAPTVSDPLSEIEYASSVLVISGHKLSDIEHPMDAYGLVIPHAEQRRILAVSFSSRKFPDRAPEGHIILRTFIGGALQPEMREHSDQELEQITLDELKSIFGVTGTPDFVSVNRYEKAMPQYHLGHLKRVARMEEELAKIPGLEIAGNAYHGVGIPDSIQSGESAVERIFETFTSSA